MEEPEHSLGAPYEELPEEKEPPVVPTWVKWLVSITAVPLLVVCFVLYLEYIKNPTGAASPEVLGLPTLLVFSISVLFVIFFPWQRFGLRVKIGPFELWRAVNAQAAERQRDISDVEERISRIEDLMSQSREDLQVIEKFRGPELRSLLLKFLTRHAPIAYSPLRIRTWGSQQPGFEKLSEYDDGFVRRTLRALVAEGILATAISRKGHTLYRAVD